MNDEYGDRDVREKLEKKEGGLNELPVGSGKANDSEDDALAATSPILSH